MDRKREKNDAPEGENSGAFFVALNDGYKPLGFINPYIYAENITSVYATDFHDVTSGVSGSYSAVKGYDLVTGWGSPNGAGLINELVTLK